MDRYTLLYLMDIQQRPYCIAHTTLLSVTWQLGWGRSLGGEMGTYLYTYGWIPLLVI